MLLRAMRNLTGYSHHSVMLSEQSESKHPYSTPEAAAQCAPGNAKPPARRSSQSDLGAPGRLARRSFFILATMPALRSATSFTEYSTDVPNTSANSGGVSL